MENGAVHAAPNNSDRLHEQHFLGSQEQGKVVTNPQFESLKQVCDSQTLQDEGYIVVSRTS